jgi:hypothetical protein
MSGYFAPESVDTFPRNMHQMGIAVYWAIKLLIA